MECLSILKALPIIKAFCYCNVERIFHKQTILIPLIRSPESYFKNMAKFPTFYTFQYEQSTHAQTLQYYIIRFEC